MMKETLILILFMGAILLPIQAQNDKNLYFGQKPPGETPEIFAPGIVSTEQFEFSGTFSPDGKEYFFTRRPDYQGSENRILYTQLINGKWTKPELAPFAKDVFEFEPIYSPNGKELYFFSNRPEDRDDRFDGDLWVTRKINDEWQEPSFFKSPVNKKWCMSVSPSSNGNLYFSGNHSGKRGVYMSKPENGIYSSVEYLPEEVNTISFAHPYISPDENILIMDAQIQGMGKPEIFVSFRQDDGSWCVPINLGPTINLTKTEFGGSLSPDGKYFFFHRRVNEIGNIYWMDAEPIYKLRPKPDKDKYQNEKCVLVIDVQKLWTQSTLSETERSRMIRSINSVLSESDPKKVIYIKTDGNNKSLVLTKKGLRIETQNDPEFDSDLNIINKQIFSKVESDAFTVSPLIKILETNKVEDIILTGLLAEKCISASALGGLARGYNIFVIPDAIGAQSERSKEKTLDRLSKKGIRIIK